VKLGQGIYGLRRAFVAAGAETIVMSLWKVNDGTTSELMEAYYHNLLAGQGRATALREAMRSLRATKPHPHYWAPFIVLGRAPPERAGVHRPIGTGPPARRFSESICISSAHSRRVVSGGPHTQGRAEHPLEPCRGARNPLPVNRYTLTWRKKMKYSVLLMGLIAASTTAFAAADTKQVEPLDFDVGLLAPLPADEAPDTGGMVKLGPAAALSYLQVYAVGSSSYGGWKVLSDPYAYTTTEDHGGPILLVAVLEIGHGGSKFAKMAGSQLPSSANYFNESVCAFINGYPYGCSAGQTVIGWIRYFDVSGYQNGLFEYQNTSFNFPWNTMYDRLSIL